MCTQLSADSPLGPQVASSLRYCQLEREETERGGQAARRGRARERGREREGVTRRAVAGPEEKKARGESLAGREVMGNGRDSEERSRRGGGIDGVMEC